MMVAGISGLTALVIIEAFGMSAVPHYTYAILLATVAICGAIRSGRK